MREQERSCIGCGIKLQTTNSKGIGYVPKQALERENIMCQRCFRIRHYGDLESVELDPHIYLNMVDQIATRESLVVQIVDLFDFNGSWIPGLIRRIGNNPLLLIGNKLDLFPKETNWARLKDWVSRSVKEWGMKPVKVVLCSAAKGLKMPEVMEAIESHRQGRDVFIVGTTNAGKSTFVNRLLLEEGGAANQITTSPYPGTTLDMIRIPLEDGKAIYDTPGIVRKDRISEWLEAKELKEVIPQSTLRPRVYQLNERQTLFFGGLIRMDYIQGSRQSFVCYVSNRLYMHRTKWEHADAFAKKHRGDLLSPPKNPEKIPPWEKHVIPLSGKEKQDIVISGLGWIATGKEKGRVEIWAPKGIEVSLRPSII